LSIEDKLKGDSQHRVEEADQEYRERRRQVNAISAKFDIEKDL
jgi:hypothetical protein